MKGGILAVLVLSSVEATGASVDDGLVINRHLRFEPKYGAWMMSGTVLVHWGGPFGDRRECEGVCRLGFCYERSSKWWDCVRACDSDLECPDGLVCGCFDRLLCSGPVTSLGLVMERACRSLLPTRLDNFVLSETGLDGSRASFYGPLYSTDRHFLRMRIAHPLVSYRENVMELVASGADNVVEYPIAYWRGKEHLVVCPPSGWSVEYVNPHPLVNVEVSCECK